MGTVLHLLDFPCPKGTDAVVSVPFSMGTVLHRPYPIVGVWPGFGFSPLLDGDGVASPDVTALATAFLQFQSPSRWGRCCIPLTARHQLALKGFQSPSRWGRCCIEPWTACSIRLLSCFSPLLDGDGVASEENNVVGTLLVCFSPLLDGDGVASQTLWPPLAHSNRFSPLLDGDGVASV